MSAAREAINEALLSEELNDGEKECIQWQFPNVVPLPGFKAVLWEAMKRADSENLFRLRLGFPEEVDALRAFRNGELGEKVKKYGVEF